MPSADTFLHRRRGVLHPRRGPRPLQCRPLLYPSPLRRRRRSLACIVYLAAFWTTIVGAPRCWPQPRRQRTPYGLGAPNTHFTSGRLRQGFYGPLPPAPRQTKLRFSPPAVDPSDMITQMTMALGDASMLAGSVFSLRAYYRRRHGPFSPGPAAPMAAQAQPATIGLRSFAVPMLETSSGMSSTPHRAASRWRLGRTCGCQLQPTSIGSATTQPTFSPRARIRIWQVNERQRRPGEAHQLQHGHLYIARQWSLAPRSPLVLQRP